MKKGLIIIASVFLLAFLVPATVFAGGKGESEEKGYLVIFSQANNAEPYRAAQNESFRKLWGAYSDVTFEITDAQQDNSRQISQIETFFQVVYIV